MASKVRPRIIRLSGAGSWTMPEATQRVRVHVVSITTGVTVQDNTATVSVPVGVYEWEAGSDINDIISGKLIVTTGISDLAIITYVGVF